VDHLNALSILARHFRGRDLRNTVVVSPDLGNAKAASAFARLLGLPVAAGSKQRLADDRVVIDTIVGDLAGRNAIILDDEIANGGTVKALLPLLRAQGVKHMTIACTHGLFTGAAIERLAGEADVEEIVTTDTVPISPEKHVPKLTVLSIAPLLAEAIQRIHVGESVSALFADH
jgi:ribose-phosphate pyrophosphokinase